MSDWYDINKQVKLWENIYFQYIISIFWCIDFVNQKKKKEITQNLHLAQNKNNLISLSKFSYKSIRLISRDNL